MRGLAHTMPIRRVGRRMRDLAEILRAAGPAYTADVIRRQFGDTRTYFQLRCELRDVPPVPSAAVDVVMMKRDVTSFHGFELELGRVAGLDAHETLQRIRSCRAGVESLYVAQLDGEPIYCQWLVRPEQQAAIQRHAPDTYEQLTPGEVLLEGAYTFTPFRGRRAMAAGMVQLLHIAREGGAEAAITYVAADNVPSLRGCARAGFVLDYQRVTTIRLGRRRSERRPVDDAARAAWQRATTGPSGAAS